MGRRPENKLSLRLLADGRTWYLSGRVMGHQIRRRHADLSALESIRAEWERKLAEAQSRTTTVAWRQTALSEAQLRDAEAAHALAAGRRLVECVTAAARVLPPTTGTLCTTARDEWLDTLRRRRRSPRTLAKNRARLDDFLAHPTPPPRLLTDILPEHCEAWVFRDPSAAAYTRITDAAVLRAWLNFCASRTRRYLLVSPFEVDTKDLTATARTTQPARILTPAQCQALLNASAAVASGRMLPYAVLATWCFLSPQEIRRTTRAHLKFDAPTPLVEVDTVKRRTAKFRAVTIPPNVLPLLRAAVQEWPATQCVPYSRSTWDRVRAAAGIIERAPPAKRGRRGTHTASAWQDNILRHTGISMLYQRLSDAARRGEFDEKSVIAEVCRQAGNTTATAFAHYLHLPQSGDAEKFYACTIAAPAPA